MNYKEFASIVPEVTKEYVNACLYVFDKIITKDRETFYLNSEGSGDEFVDGYWEKVTYIKNKNNKMFAWLIQVLYNESSYLNLLTKIDFNHNKLWYHNTKEKVNYEKCINNP